MSKFTPKVTKQYEFDGDTINVTFRRLKRAEALTLAPYARTEADGITVSFENQIKLLEVTGELLPNVIERFTGLFIDDVEVDYIKDGDTKNLDGWNSFLEEAYFFQLHSDILLDILNASFLSGDDKKKLQSSPESTGKESET